MPARDPIAIELSSSDIIKLHAATTLSLYHALEAAGVIDTHVLGRMLRAQAAAAPGESWAMVVAVLAKCIEAPSKPLEPPAAEQGVGKIDRRFVVIDGGVIDAAAPAPAEMSGENRH